jgi:hypothetical protein
LHFAFLSRQDPAVEVKADQAAFIFIRDDEDELRRATPFGQAKEGRPSLESGIGRDQLFWQGKCRKQP